MYYVLVPAIPRAVLHKLTLLLVMLLEMSHLIWWSHTKTWVVKCDMVVYRQLQVLGLTYLYTVILHLMKGYPKGYPKGKVKQRITSDWVAVCDSSHHFTYPLRRQMPASLTHCQMVPPQSAPSTCDVNLPVFFSVHRHSALCPLQQQAGETDYQDQPRPQGKHNDDPNFHSINPIYTELGLECYKFCDWNSGWFGRVWNPPGVVDVWMETMVHRLLRRDTLLLCCCAWRQGEKVAVCEEQHSRWRKSRSSSIHRIINRKVRAAFVFCIPRMWVRSLDDFFLRNPSSGNLFYIWRILMNLGQQLPYPATRVNPSTCIEIAGNVTPHMVEPYKNMSGKVWHGHISPITSTRFKSAVLPCAHYNSKLKLPTRSSPSIKVS